MYAWDITKLHGPRKWTYFYLYAVIDIYSRYIVGWMVADRESSELAKKLLRSVISQYTLDKQKAPQSLDDLVTAGYLKKLPVDPMTGRNDGWQVEQEDVLLAVDQQEPGITDVHSSSNLSASDGTVYSSW